ncbi:MAG: AMP-binding protein, partial [Pseudomonadota bacterium]
MALTDTANDGYIGPDQPVSVHGCDTIAGLFRHQCRQLANTTAHREKLLGIWKAYSWSDYYRDACQIGAGLTALGMTPGDRVAILSEDNRDWLCCDMGITVAGGIPTGVYTTDSAQQLAYIVNDSGATFLLLENDEQLDKFLQVQHELPGLLKVIVFERDGLRDLNHQRVLFLDQLVDTGKQYLQRNPDYIDSQIDNLSPADTALLIYTSGTTGQPKGAMISHRNVIFQLTVCQQLLDIRDTDDQLCFLPLCHIYERVLSAHLPLTCGTTVNFTESVDTVFDNMREVSPHTFSAVPRFWEKVYSQIRIHRAEATGIGRWALDAAVASGLAKQQAPQSWFNRLRYRIWDLIVLRNLRRMTGMDRMRRGGSGAAPVSVELLQWFNALGVQLLEGYGATET